MGVDARADVLAPFGYGFAFRSLLTPPNPGAGLPFELEIGATITRPASLILTLATSADAGDRYLTVEYQRGGTVYAVSAAAATFGPNETQRFVFSRAYTVASWNPGTDFLVPLDPSFLDPGDVLAVAVAGMDNGDTLTGIAARLEHFPVGDEGYPTGRVEALPEPLAIPTSLDRLEAFARENDLATLPWRSARVADVEGPVSS